MSAVSPLASIDWQVVAAAAATFVGTIFLTFKGIQKGREKVQEGAAPSGSITSIVGATIMENETIRQFTEQMRLNTQMLHDHCEQVRANTAAITRQTDLGLMQSRKLDYRDARDHD